MKLWCVIICYFYFFLSVEAQEKIKYSKKIKDNFAIGVVTGTVFTTHFEDFKNGAWNGFLTSHFEYNITPIYGLILNAGYYRYSYSVQDQKSISPITGKIFEDKFVASIGTVIYYNLSRFLRFDIFQKIKSGLQLSLFIDTPILASLNSSFDNQSYNIKNILNNPIIGFSVALIFSFNSYIWQNLYLSFSYSRSFISQWKTIDTNLFSFPVQGRLQFFTIGVGFKLYVL